MEGLMIYIYHTSLTMITSAPSIRIDLLIESFFLSRTPEKPAYARSDLVPRRMRENAVSLHPFTALADEKTATPRK